MSTWKVACDEFTDLYQRTPHDMKGGTVPYYDPRVVPCHGSDESTVFLVNEAPGPCEAHYLIPAVGPQGGNIYRAFRRAGIDWACDFEEFCWPSKVLDRYRNPGEKLRVFELRDQFLAVRARYMTCTNAYNLWPRRGPASMGWVKPPDADLLSTENLTRLRKEVTRKHSIILVCGAAAWLGCYGLPLADPASREGTPLTPEELQKVNDRLGAKFVEGWYMGHTRRWTLNVARSSAVLKQVALRVRWRVRS